MTRIFDRTLIVGLVLVVVLLFLSIGVAYRNIQHLHDDSRGVARAHQTLVALDRLVLTIKDASLGVTGYLITGQLSLYSSLPRRRGREQGGKQRSAGVDAK
jgi:CHASE3 domain sensor protein